jgi:hypothetical protein
MDRTRTRSLSAFAQGVAGNTSSSYRE